MNPNKADNNESKVAQDLRVLHDWERKYEGLVHALEGVLLGAKKIDSKRVSDLAIDSVKAKTYVPFVALIEDIDMLDDAVCEWAAPLDK